MASSGSGAAATRLTAEMMTMAKYLFSPWTFDSHAHSSRHPLLT